MLKLGNKVKDTVSGIEGILVWKTECLNGCIQWGIQPKYKGSGDVLTYNIDEQQIIKTGDGLVKKEKSPLKPKKKRVKKLRTRRGAPSSVSRQSAISCGER